MFDSSGHLITVDGPVRCAVWVKFQPPPQAPQAENTWCMRQLVYIENCMGKSPIVKKLCK